MPNKVTTYLRDSVAELKKVTWPTRTETINHTLLVVGISVALAIFLGALDYLFTIGFEYLINR